LRHGFAGGAFPRAVLACIDAATHATAARSSVSDDLLPTIDCTNRLLRMLGETEYRALAPRLERVRLARRDVVCRRGGIADAVYFPGNCLLSVLTPMHDGTTVEAGMIGREGFAGIEVLLGAACWNHTVVCQIEGDCLWMPAVEFRAAIAGDTGLRRAVQRFVVAYLGLVMQSVACNRVHKVEARFARWILMTADRVGDDMFYLTQEFISQMLGVRRPSVSTVAGAFQQAGLIRYTRGCVTILDRAGLERVSCECYAACRQQAEELLRASDVR
jgi:CRP-like cAMP-binding protein